VRSGVGCRCGLDPALLWLWNRPVAIAPIRPLDWESPYAMGAALEKAKRQKKKKKKRKRKSLSSHCEAYVSLCSFASDLLMFL